MIFFFSVKYVPGKQFSLRSMWYITKKHIQGLCGVCFGDDGNAWSPQSPAQEVTLTGMSGVSFIAKQSLFIGASK